MKNVSPKSGESLDAEGQIDFQVFFKGLFLLIRENRIRYFLGLGGRELRVVKFLQNTVNAYLWSRIRCDMQIRGSLIHHCSQ